MNEAPRIARRMMLYDEPVPLEFVRGDATGLAIPAHGEALRAAGETFLTEAFRSFRSLSPNNRIVRITRLEPFPGGNSGHKLFLSVEYAHTEPGLHTDLFVKFSRDFTDAFRDRRRHELQAEVCLAGTVASARLSDQRSHRLFCGLSPRIRHRHAHHAANRLRQRRHRAAAAEMHGPRTFRTARLLSSDRNDPRAARRRAQSQGCYPRRSMRTFHSIRKRPPPPTRFPGTSGSCANGSRVMRHSSQAAPSFCPPMSPRRNSSARLERDAVRFLRHEATIKRFLHADRDFIALCHYNANIDNAWFWRDRSGALSMRVARLGAGPPDECRLRALGRAVRGEPRDLGPRTRRIARALFTARAARSRRSAARCGGAQAPPGFLRGDDGPRRVDRGTRPGALTPARGGRRPVARSIRYSARRSRTRLPACFHGLLEPLAAPRLRSEPGPVGRLGRLWYLA